MYVPSMISLLTDFQLMSVKQKQKKLGWSSLKVGACCGETFQRIEKSAFEVCRLAIRFPRVLKFIRFIAFFVHFNTLILRRAHKRFSFRNCSVGNCFLAAARDMLGGLPGAIFMFKAITDSQDTGDVVPVILTNQRITIAAELDSGQVITGQCEISHPAPAAPPPPAPMPTTSSRPTSRLSRRRRDSMSFSTVESSDEDGSASESEGSTAGALGDGQSHLTAEVTGSTARPGSPWRDATHLPQLAAVSGSSHLRRPSVRRAVSTQQFDELAAADQNALYVKGSEEIPLESRIERE